MDYFKSNKKPLIRILPASGLTFVRLLVICLLLVPGSAVAETILLSDDFSSGLDTSTWNPWGYPMPYVDTTSGNSVPSLNPNGDSYYHSGVVSDTPFILSPTEKLTVSMDAKIEYGTQWSELTFGLVTSPHSLSSATSANPPIQYTEAAVVILDVDPQNNEKYLVRFNNGSSQTIYLNANGHVPTAYGDYSEMLGEWHNYQFVINADGSVDFLVDETNVIAGASNKPVAGYFETNTNYHLLLGGRSKGYYNPPSAFLSNGNSGDNRYDNVLITTTVVPLPSTYAMLAVGLCAMSLAAVCRRRRPLR